MHRFARILCIGFLFAALALTAPVDCSPGSLQSYLDLAPEGCTIDDKVVLGFTLLDLLSVGDQISPDSILVTPLPTPLNPGFRFDVYSNAAASELLQSRFAFAVLVNPGGRPIGSVSATLGGSLASPDGAVTAVADLCLGAAFVAGTCGAATDTLILFDIGVDALLQGSRGFEPVRTLGVANDIVVDGGLNGSASLSSLTIRFQEVPEPATFVSVIASLLALTLLRRRR